METLTYFRKTIGYETLLFLCKDDIINVWENKTDILDTFILVSC